MSLRFRPERRQHVPWSLLALLCGALVLLGLRSVWPAPASVSALVTVQGEVPNPGTYAIERPTVAAAIRAAGGAPTEAQDVHIPPGQKVVVTGGRGRLAPVDRPLLVGLPLDPNTATALQLDALPGVGPKTAERIVLHREEHGLFRSDAAFRRVTGRSYDTLAPFVQLSDVGLIDPNTATLRELTTLPGIGEVLAARIIVDRTDHGDYTTVDDLQRVSGIGPALAERLDPYVRLR